MRMTKKHATMSLAGTASLVAAVVLWPSAASADRVEDGPPHGEVVEGDFVSEREEEYYIDHDGDALASLGDELIYTNSSTGVLGDATDYGRCVFHEVDLSADRATLSCISTTAGAHGSITAQGTTRVRLSHPDLLEQTHWAITGGTGEWLGAEGQVHLVRFEGDGLDFRALGTIRLVVD